MRFTAHNSHKTKCSVTGPLFFIALAFFACLPAQAQLVSSHNALSPIQLNAPQNLDQQFLRQNPSVLPTDTTPFQLNRARYGVGSQFQFRLFQKLPARFWFTAVTEESGRLETNAFQTAGSARQDFVFRSLPNITAGYALTERTNVYCNYFVIKDLYAAHGDALNFPTTMSLSMGLRRDFPIGTKTVLQFDAQARELWETAGLNQADLLPAINLTRIITPRVIFFGSVLLQMRSHYPFEGPTRELDPFYNIGMTASYRDWTFVASQTYVTNFRDPPFRGSIPSHGVVNMILDFEAAHPISQRIPGLVTFIRAEPIFNWRSGYVPGQSGFDFRLYGGLRLTIAKPAYNSDMDDLRTKLKRAAQLMKQLQDAKSSGAATDGQSNPSAPPIKDKAIENPDHNDQQNDQ